MIKTILFTHDDLDGAGCRILYALAKHPNENNEHLIINCSNGGVDNTVLETISREDVDINTKIYFGDIVASREVLESMKTRGFDVYIYDHHRTNFFATWVFDNAVIIPETDLGVLESGTSLIFKAICNGIISCNNMELFNSTLIEEFVEHVRLWDTYQWKETNKIEARKLQILYILLGMERFCKLYIDKLLNANQESKLFDDNAAMFIDAKMENDQKNIDGITKDKVYDVDIRGFKCAFALSKDGADTSELGSQFLAKYPEYDVMVTFSLFGDGAYSFRSARDNIDVGADIAVPIGGGGHPKAAGAPMSSTIKEEMTKLILKELDPNFTITKCPVKKVKEENVVSIPIPNMNAIMTSEQYNEALDKLQKSFQEGAEVLEALRKVSVIK